MADTDDQKVSVKSDKDPNSSRRDSCSARPQRPSSCNSNRTKTSDGLPSPDSPRFRLTRKRAAGYMDAEVGAHITTSHPRAGSGDSGRSVASHVCLCQPDPKIPRPRNAFILYRQHHQASVVAQNPGLANPEISKIIGEQWRTQPQEVKNQWKHLADEEKARHQQQYPEYRYQPRRGQRGSASSLGTPTTNKLHCEKCGGRSILTPGTPLSATQPRLPVLPAPEPSAGVTSTRYLPMNLSNLSLQSPAAGGRGGRPQPPHLSNVPLSRLATDRRPPIPSPMSPDAKRRRTNMGPGPYVPLSSRPGDSTPFPFGVPATNRRESLPAPAQLLRQSPPTSMGPPPRPQRGSFSPGRPPHSSPESLTLPPIQTAQDQSRSVEAMVMSMPYLGKIKILRKITPPLKTPSPGSPAPAVRGAVVAVEGDDIEAVKSLTRWLEEFLNRSGGDYVAKVAEAPKRPQEKDTGEPTLGDYLNIIAEWHVKSNEMKEYITNPVSSDDNHSSNSQAQPVVLLPTYQLSASDAYACRVPISDSYSPADHWQWMATMWRGIIGPDITIYIRDSSGEEAPSKDRLVEIKEETKCLIVNKNRGSSSVEERALRRVGFEVGEWIRTIGITASGQDRTE